MLKMKRTMDNDGRLAATWNVRNQIYVAPSYLSAETADHTASTFLYGYDLRKTLLAMLAIAAALCHRYRRRIDR